METYNTLFKLEELLSAITKSSESAFGSGEIRYQMLKLVPDVTLETVLQTRNTFYGTRYLSHCSACFAFNPLFVNWVTSDS